MNHIIAALFAIGILFGIWAGYEKKADADAVAADIQAVGAAVESMPEGAAPAAIQQGLAQISAPLERLTSARLPREMTQRLSSFNTSLEAATAAAAGLDSAAATAPPEVARALAGLSASWDNVVSSAAVTNQSLIIASLTAQGEQIFTAVSAKAKACVLDLAFPMIGIMAFWLGIMRVAEEAGLIQALARLFSPFFRVFFPKVPKDHPANGAILMSLSANMIGLDNAATPLSLKAMKDLQTLNTDKDTLTNDQGMLLTLNATCITIVPFSLIAWRLIYNSAFANAIILPILIATTSAATAGVITWVFVRRLSKDPAATGEEAARLTAELNADLGREKK